MASSDPLLTWSNSSDTRHSQRNRSRVISSPQYSNEWQPTASLDSDIIPSYVDILANSSGQDWLESYEFPTASKSKEKITHRRTFDQGTSKSQAPITVRKTKSMRDAIDNNKINFRSKLRSPPPPPPLPPSHDDTPLNVLIEQQQTRLTTDKKLPFINKVKRKLSFNKDKPTLDDTRRSLPPPNKPRRTVSSGVLAHDQQQFTSNSLAEYQGYTRHNRHRSFTYSPPPPRSSSLKATTEPLPCIPPVPPVPKHHAATSTSTTTSRPRTVSKKKSDNSSLNSVSSGSNKNSSVIVKRHSSLNSVKLVPEYNLTDDLAQIEKDIKALEIQRQSFILAKQPIEETKTIGRKRGKTLPGSLATPPPIPLLPLPPMQLNPIQMTIPTHISKKQSNTSSPRLHKSISTTPTTNRIKLSLLSSFDDHSSELFMKQRRKEVPPPPPIVTASIPMSVPGLGLGSGIAVTELSPRTSSKPTQPMAMKRSVSSSIPKRKSHSNTHTPKPTITRATSYKQPSTQDDHGRVPKSVYTALKYYGQYLSDYERTEINDYPAIYFVGPHAKTKYGQGSVDLNFGFDDERGDYKIIMQDHLAYRYEVIDILGRGSFGQVVKCFDHKTSCTVAIKLIRNKKRFHAQAVTEVNILKKLTEWDPEDQFHTIQMTDHFSFRNHLCIAFECLSMNLYEFIKSNHFQGFSLNLIKGISFQILQSLAMLSEHNVIHCDLKPENIMLRHPAKSSIKVIDFGSSCFESERVYTYIQSRFYRSPEVILGLSYGKAIDMWSVGCIAAELYTGLPLFPGENEQEQLSCIMETMGVPDRQLIERCSRKKLFFDSNGHPRIVANSKGKKRLPRTKSIYQALKCHDIVFIDFIERCLHWDPSKRLTPKQALHHEFITENTITPPKPVQSFLSSSALNHHYNKYTSSR